ncbi:hypothetical protein [Glaciihabitans tibetensis]|nr:hypothetical protein [Glaciihabitans tibetensis]
MVLALAAGVGVTQTIAAEPASAAEASAFNPGNIISDAKFHDSAAMTSQQIQSFLEIRVPTCAPGGNCLKNYRQDTWTRSADAQCRAYTGATQERASTIISRVATACGINPQVLLVLLQKEQTLVTSTAPDASKYIKATGYACPDTAPCDAQFSGFYNQVYKAAWQYRYYENHASSYRYKANTVVNIQYNPNPGCGTQPVYIENQATANLYIYTPYVPNRSALANLYGSGDSCGAYGNRNFWRMFSDWFGSPTGPKSTHGALDLAVGVGGGVQVRGWAVDPYSKDSTYLWVEVDGVGTSIRADDPLNWIEGIYPGYGTKHGYDDIVRASAGQHRVCVYQTNGTAIGCSTVAVPSSSRGVGNVDTATAVQGGVRLTGWSLDKTTSAPQYIWVNVDGQGGAYKVDVDLPWTGGAYPGTGSRHGFDVTVKASPGAHLVCVSGSEALLGCKTVTVPTNEAGSFESAVGVLGGVQITGWSLDQSTSASTYVWATAGATGKPFIANVPSQAAASAYPNVKGPHGFSGFIPTAPGEQKVCVNGTSEGRSYGCKTVVVPNTETGHLDTATGVLGGVNVSGWALDQTKSTMSYVWFSIDGEGGAPLKANLPLTWIEGLYPGAGPNHGFSGFIPTTPGTHEICATATKEGQPLGCITTTVPYTETGHLDTATGVLGGVNVSGWALDQTKSTMSYVWFSIDGEGGAPLKANLPLTWIEGLYPGAGPNHGFSGFIPTTPGTHEICATATKEGAPLGCITATVPDRYPNSVDSVTGVAGGVRITGWAAQRDSTATLYLWVDIDGVGTAVAANRALPWINAYLPGVGDNHGIDTTIPTPSGTHQVCMMLTADGRSLGCRTVTVP